MMEKQYSIKTLCADTYIAPLRSDMEKAPDQIRKAANVIRLDPVSNTSISLVSLDQVNQTYPFLSVSGE